MCCAALVFVFCYSLHSAELIYLMKNIIRFCIT